MSDENRYEWDSSLCVHDWETINIDTPTINDPKMTNQQTSYLKCSKCLAEDRSQVMFSFTAPCRATGVIYDE